MRTWIIGSTSDWSLAVADRCHGVTKFGRDNIDYGASFESFIKRQEYLPNQIFINIGIEEKVSTKADALDIDWNGMLAGFMPTFLWKLRLYSYFYKQNIPCVICDVTSTITSWPQQYRDHLPYSVMRAMGQQILKAHNTDTLKLFQVSPNGLTKDRIDEYADKTVAWMNEPDLALTNNPDSTNKPTNYIVDLDTNNLIGVEVLETE